MSGRSLQRTRQRQRIEERCRILREIRQPSFNSHLIPPVPQSLNLSPIRINNVRQSVASELVTSTTVEDIYNNSGKLEIISSNVGTILPNLTITPIDLALRQWTVNHNVKQSALKSLLVILKNSYPNNNLPTDPRTLMKTPRKLKIDKVSGGEFFYFGVIGGVMHRVKSGLKKTTATNIENMLGSGPVISITIGVDGIPISKSSNKQFWPILGLVDNSLNNTPFVIGIYYAEHKPTNLDFLKQFVEECKVLELNGINLSGTNYRFRISKILADAPARSFVKGVKMHNSYFSCERCTEQGDWNGRVTFLNLTFTKRTDESFTLKTQKSHHVKETLLSELKIGLVSQVPLDYLHLVCLGVTRKLCRMWVKGRLPFRLLARKTMLISNRLFAFRKDFPKDFQRKPRSLLQIDHFKGTEFRTLLLYTGVAALRYIIPLKEYKNYLRFHTALYILLSPKANDPGWNTTAKNLLKKFVKYCIKIYGNEFAVYNVHGLLHINEDALLFGQLDNASTFHFESFMQKIKILLSSHNFHLEQVVKRIMEMEAVHQDITMCNQAKIVNFSPKDMCKNGGNCYMLKSGKIVIVSNFEQVGEITHYTCQEFMNRRCVEYYPIDSSELYIFFSSGLSELSKIELLPDDFLFKYIMLPFKTEFLLIPILHSLKL